MDSINIEQISECLKNKKTISIPLLQKELEINYAAAKEVINRLLNAEAVQFDSGIEYKVISERLEYLFNRKISMEEYIEQEKLMERKEALERRQAEMYERLHFQLNEMLEGDDDNDTDNDQCVRFFDDFYTNEENIIGGLKEAGINIDILMEVIALGIKNTRDGKSFTVSAIIRKFGYSFVQAAKIFDFMRDRRYVVRDPNDAKRFIVSVPDEELQKLKDLNDDG